MCGYVPCLVAINHHPLRVQIALISGVVIAAPYIMYQVWLFIAPGLYANEKKLAIPFVVMSTVCFLAGAAFNHFITLHGKGAMRLPPGLLPVLSQVPWVTGESADQNGNGKIRKREKKETVEV